MSNQSEKYVQNIIKQNNAQLSALGPVNTPAQYENRQYQYLAKQTTQFIKARAKYSSDFVQANVQGLNNSDFYEYASTFIRFSDVVSQTAITINSSAKNVDDIKLILFAEPSIDYFPVGAKIQTMGNTWICTNPSNISSVHGTALIQRCNASYNSYDYYGNIVTEPIIIEKLLPASNNNKISDNLVLMEGYFNVICQLNSNTTQLGQNQRIILGSKAYHITGFTDFIQEFSGNYDSIHLLRFTIRIEEPTVDDDLINHIANGKNNSFNVVINGPTELQEGETAQFSAFFIKNNQNVQATTDYPLTWLWQSSNPAIATVDNNGNVNAISEGTVQISATLQQGTGLTQMIQTTVKKANLSPFVNFIGVIPESISQYSNATLTAGYYENGTLTANQVVWSFSGAAPESYYTEINNNTATIYCVKSSETPLVVSVSFADYTMAVAIDLEAY